MTQQIAHKFEEHRNHYMHEAQLARAAVAQFAGFRSPQEMAQPAQEDPAGWVAENQRQQNVASILNSLDERIRSEQAQNSQHDEARTRQMYEHAWSELSKDGVDEKKLTEIYQSACQAYGFKMDDFSSVYDPRAVRVLKDNAAMRQELAALRAKAKTVTKQAQDAPRIPNKQALAVNERKSRALSAKFSTGNAKLSDLASLLS